MHLKQASAHAEDSGVRRRNYADRLGLCWRRRQEW